MDKPSLELDTFQLSVLDLGLSLTVWTHLYTSDEATSQLSCEKLYGRVKNGQLWFLPPGVISVQIVVQLEHRLISYPCPQTVLEILEASIRESSLWKMLGLSITLRGIEREAEKPETLKFYFRVEHADNSSALLSPPNVETSTMSGIACVFKYSLISSGVGNDAADDIMAVESLDEIGGHPNTWTPGPVSQHLQPIVDLAIAALHEILGVRKRCPGIRYDDRMSLTLLELAPAVWNAHYMQATAAHSKNLSVISDIITTAGEWRPSLRQKVSALLDGDAADFRRPGALNSDEAQVLLHISAQERLWALLTSTMDIKMGVKRAVSKTNKGSNRIMQEDLAPQLFRHDSSDLPEAGAMKGPFPEAQTQALESRGIDRDMTLQALGSDVTLHDGHLYDEHLYDEHLYDEHLYDEHSHDEHLYDEYLYENNYNGDLTHDTARFGGHDGYGGAALQTHQSYQTRRTVYYEASYDYGSTDTQQGDHGGANGQWSDPVQFRQTETDRSDELPTLPTNNSETWPYGDPLMTTTTHI